MYLHDFTVYVTILLSTYRLLSLSPFRRSAKRSEDEHHPVKHFHQVCPGHQCDSRGVPLPVQHPLYSRPDTKFPGCLDLLQHPQHLDVCRLSKKCGKTRRLLLHMCCQRRTKLNKNEILHYQVVADLLMTLTIPLRVLSDAGVGSWQLRAFHCRYSAVLFYITMYISILLLGLISLDRYLKIVRPFGKCPLQKVRVGQVLSAVVWVVMLSIALPNAILSDQLPKVSGGRLKCTSLKSRAGLIWHEGINYFCQVAIEIKEWLQNQPRSTAKAH